MLIPCPRKSYGDGIYRLGLSMGMRVGMRNGNDPVGMAMAYFMRTKIPSRNESSTRLNKNRYITRLVYFFYTAVRLTSKKEK